MGCNEPSNQSPTPCVGVRRKGEHLLFASGAVKKSARFRKRVLIATNDEESSSASTVLRRRRRRRRRGIPRTPDPAAPSSGGGEVHERRLLPGPKVAPRPSAQGDVAQEILVRTYAAEIRRRRFSYEERLIKDQFSQSRETSIHFMYRRYSKSTLSLP